MQSLIYKNCTLEIYQIKTNPYLLTLEDIANALDIYPKLITLTLETESFFFKQDFHYFKTNDEIYFSRVGIIRLAILIGSVEATEFALFCEKELMAFENFYEKLMIAGN